MRSADAFFVFWRFDAAQKRDQIRVNLTLFSQQGVRQPWFYFLKARIALVSRLAGFIIIGWRVIAHLYRHIDLVLIVGTVVETQPIYGHDESGGTSQEAWRGASAYVHREKNSAAQFDLLNLELARDRFVIVVPINAFKIRVEPVF